jgi:hypothetical protein
MVGTIAQPVRRNRASRYSLFPAKIICAERIVMLAKILGAIAGEKIAGRNQKVTGALVGAAIPAIARRGLGPLALVLSAGWGAKKLIERRKARRGQSA